MQTFRATKGEFVDFERGFLIKISLTSIIISTVGLLINFALGLGIILYIIPIVSIFVYGLLFFLARKTQNVIFVKWLFVVITFIFLNLLWVFNYGSHGPAPYFFILIYTLLIFIFSKNQLIVVTAALGLNIAIFFFLDMYYPGVTEDYGNETNRIVDVYTGLVIYAFIVFILIFNAKNNFINEYLKAKTSDNVKANFLDNISHEIRTPLNAIVGFSSILSAGVVSDEDREEYVGAIDESTAALLKIVTDILDVSQIEAGGIELHHEKIVLNDFLSETQIKHQKILKGKGKEHIEFSLQLPDKNVEIHFDKHRFEQIFSILLDNAIKFTSKGNIELGCEVKYSKFLFWVKDTGIGIEDDFKDKVFKSFTKKEKSTSGKFGGIGIGLFLARALIELNEGKLWFTSKPDKGTIFYFKIPRITSFSKFLTSNHK